MNNKREQILAALKKLGPSSPGVIADKIGVADSACGYHLRVLAAAGELKVQGKSNSRRYALPDQEFEAADAPPQDRKPRKKTKQRKSANTRTTRARPAAEPEIIAAITHDARIVLIENGAVKTYSPQQSSAIADLVLTHFSA